MRTVRIASIFAAFMISAAPLVPATFAAAGSDESSANQAGQQAFKANCIVCHGADGGGTPLGKSIQAPDLRSEEVQKKSDTELAQFVSEGKGNMPSFKRILDPEQVKAVVGYIRELGKSKQ